MNLYGFANGDPVNFSDPFGLCGVHTGLFRSIANFFDSPCKTRDEAAIRALNDVRQEIGVRGTEYVGEIVSVDGGYRYTEPRYGRRTSAPTDVGVAGYEGTYHSHPNLASEGYDTENFSGKGGDKELADNAGKPNYVLTPQGRILRYDPDPAKKQGGTVTQIGKTKPYDTP